MTKTSGKTSGKTSRKTSGKNSNGLPNPFLLLNIFLILLIFIFIILGVYFFHFKRQPIDQILASNEKLNSLHPEEVPRYGQMLDDGVVASRRTWDSWIREKGLLAIGNIYGTCNETNSVTIGRVVMMQDPDTGNLVTETILNITLDRDLHKGNMHMATYINGHHLNTKDWDICRNEMNKYSDNLLVDCPVLKGPHHIVKKKKIPSYLPKASYTVKMWATDENEEIIICGTSAFTL